MGQTQVIKKRFKLYKAGKRWLIAGIAFAGIQVSLAGMPTGTRAAETDTTTQVTPTESIANEDQTSQNLSSDSQTTSDVNATGQSANPEKSQAVQQQTTTTQNTQTVTTPATERTESVSQQPAQPVDNTEYAVHTKTPDTAKAQPTATVTHKQTTNSQTTNSQVTETSSTTTQRSQNVTVNKTVSQSNPTQSEEQPVKAQAEAESTAKAETSKANDSAAKANEMATQLNELLKNPKPSDASWLNQINQLADQLKETAENVSGNLGTVNEAITDYQNTLDRMAHQPQPNAIKQVTLDGKDQTATLESYTKLVNDYVSQINSQLAKLNQDQQNQHVVAGVRDAAAQLLTAADHLNEQLKAVSEAANAGNIDDNQTALAALQTAKEKYDQAKDAYNSLATVYNNTHNAQQTDISTINSNEDATQPDGKQNPTETAFINFVKDANSAAVQNNAFNQYQSATTDYETANQSLSVLNQAIDEWKAASDTYNQKIHDTQLTVDELTAITNTVIESQDRVKNALAKFGEDNDQYNQSLADYQSALDLYNADTHNSPIIAADGFQDSTSGSEWQRFQDQLKQLESNFENNDQSISHTNAVTMAANLDQVTYIGDVIQATDALQAKVNQLNELAAAQQAAVAQWDQTIAEATQDGRWALYYPQISVNAETLAKADYAYIDAINGTQTDFKTVTETIEKFGKTYTTFAVDQTTNDAQTSYEKVFTDFQNAISQYNQKVSGSQQINPELGTAIDLIKADANALTDDVQSFTTQYSKMVTVLAGLAADKSQNDAVKKLIVTDDVNSTDGSYPSHATYRTRSGQSIVLLVHFTDGDWSQVIGTNMDDIRFNRTEFYSERELKAAGNLPTDHSHKVTKEMLERLLEPGLFYDITLGIAGQTQIEVDPKVNYFDDGKTYYLAGYGIYQPSNSGLEMQGTDKIYTFVTDDPLQELMDNDTRLGGDPSQTTQIVLYYLTTGIDESLIPDSPKATEKIADVTIPINPLGTVDTASQPTGLVSPNQISQPVKLTTLTYLSGENLAPTFETIAFGQAPLISLNDSVAPTVDPNEGGNIPDKPSNPGDGHTPDTPTIPDDGYMPNTPGHSGNNGETPNGNHGTETPAIPGNNSGSETASQTPGNSQISTEQSVITGGTDQQSENSDNDTHDGNTTENNVVDEANAQSSVQENTGRQSGMKATDFTGAYSSNTDSQTPNGDAADQATDTKLQRAAMLPQTGEQNEAQFTVLGLVILALAGILGKAIMKRKHG